jgi:hypothetical protein
MPKILGTKQYDHHQFFIHFRQFCEPNSIAGLNLSNKASHLVQMFLKFALLIDSRTGFNYQASYHLDFLDKDFTDSKRGQNYLRPYSHETQYCDKKILR